MSRKPLMTRRKGPLFVGYNAPTDRVKRGLLLGGLATAGAAGLAGVALGGHMTPPGQPLGAVSLEGELMDAKCWLGSMRPGEGLTHKGCAELCVRSGLPLLFVTGGPERTKRVFIALGPDGAILDTDVLPFVADPVRVTGAVAQRDGWLRLNLAPDGIVRLPA